MQPALTAPDPARPPIFNVPPGIRHLALFLLVVHVARLFLPPSRDALLVSRLAFIPENYAAVLHHARPLRLTDWPLLTSPVTYMLLHGGWAHLGLNLLSLAAFGSPVERLAGAWRMLAIFVLAGIGGAVLQVVVSGPAPLVLIGASGGITGLFAAAYLAYAPPQKLRSRLGGILLLGAGLVASGLMGVPGLDTPVAWVAHLGGFLTGLALARLVRPSPS